VDVCNTGPRPGVDVVQLYAHDVVGTTTRPVAQLVGFTRVGLVPGEVVRVELHAPTTRLAATDRRMRRTVEPGEVELWVGTSSVRAASGVTELVGGVHEITDDPRVTVVTTAPASAGEGAA
jgi:beta-glucosidase